MKKAFLYYILFFVFQLFATNFLFADVTLQFFTAKSYSGGIFIEWKTSHEGNISKFELERSDNTPDNFISITSVNATGDNSYYSFQDNTYSGMKNSSNEIFYYRLKCIDNSGAYVYTNYITVTQSVSGIKKTWGSIKAIFR